MKIIATKDCDLVGDEYLDNVEVELDIRVSYNEDILIEDLEKGEMYIIPIDVFKGVLKD